jgi:hypothetical protein
MSEQEFLDQYEKAAREMLADIPFLIDFLNEWTYKDEIESAVEEANKIINGE